jgi:uncharacterized protein
MPDTNDITLILHGWGGNKPAHWQEHLYNALAEAGAAVRYPKMPDPTAPHLESWIDAITLELSTISDNARLSVVAHSLGAISWMHVASRSNALLAERVLLVAPPYVIREVPPLDAPAGTEGFFPPPLDPNAIARAAGHTAIVASNNDDYATYDQTAAYADRLKIDIFKLEGAGHISPYWGYGEWPWITEWCLRRSGLPPMPR